MAEKCSKLAEVIGLENDIGRKIADGSKIKIEVLK
jgi:hypothetical protein